MPTVQDIVEVIGAILSKADHLENELMNLKAQNSIESGVVSVNDKTSSVVLSKADVGLGNVDNTSDFAKAISVAVLLKFNEINARLAALENVQNIEASVVSPLVASGFVIHGQTLTATGGTSYQWRRDGVDISLATSSTYVVTPEDESKDITCYDPSLGIGSTSNVLSNWSPHDAAFLAWGDPDDAATLNIDVSNNILQMNDKMGNGNHFIPEDLSSSPFLNESSEIEFQNTKAFVLANNPLAVNHPFAASFMRVTQSRTWGNTLASYGGEGDVGGWKMRQFSSAVDSTCLTLVGASNGANHDSTSHDKTVNHINISKRYNTTRSMRYNGNIMHSGDVGSNDLFDAGTSIKSVIGGVSIADGTVLPNLYGITKDIIVANNVDDVTTEKLEGYLAHKHGSTDDMPMEHPYKITPP